MGEFLLVQPVQVRDEAIQLGTQAGAFGFVGGGVFVRIEPDFFGQGAG
jgi:hypothetical protein